MEIIRAGGFAEYLVSQIGALDAEGRSFEQRLCSAMRSLGVVQPGELLLSYEEWHNYEQRGGETYIAAAQIVVAGRHGNVTRPFVSKAVLCGHHTTRRMLSRRAQLASWGIPVPHLYSAADACIVEQYIPHCAQDCLAQGRVLHDVIHAAAVLDLQGFPTLGFIHDMRSDGERAYYVDFGWDLWDPLGYPVGHAFTTLMDLAGKHVPELKGEIEHRYQQVREQCGAP